MSTSRAHGVPDALTGVPTGRQVTRSPVSTTPLASRAITEVGDRKVGNRRLPRPASWAEFIRLAMPDEESTRYWRIRAAAGAGSDVVHPTMISFPSQLARPLIEPG